MFVLRMLGDASYAEEQFARCLDTHLTCCNRILKNSSMRLSLVGLITATVSLEPGK